MPSIKMTARAVETLLPPGSGQIDYWDAVNPGFGLRVSVGGRKAWVLMKPRGLARVTGGRTAAVRAVGLLGGMLSYANEVGHLDHNPARGVRKPADNRRSFRLGPEGYRTLGEALERAEARSEHWQATTAIRLLALTGCRRSEVLNLKWSEVDFKASCLRLGDTKTGASIRPLPAPARAILTDEIGGYPVAIGRGRSATHGPNGGPSPIVSTSPRRRPARSGMRQRAQSEGAQSPAGRFSAMALPRHIRPLRYCRVLGFKADPICSI